MREYASDKDKNTIRNEKGKKDLKGRNNNVPPNCHCDEFHP